MHIAASAGVATPPPADAAMSMQLGVFTGSLDKWRLYYRNSYRENHKSANFSNIQNSVFRKPFEFTSLVSVATLWCNTFLEDELQTSPSRSTSGDLRLLRLAISAIVIPIGQISRMSRTRSANPECLELGRQEAVWAHLLSKCCNDMVQHFPRKWNQMDS